ncbi:formate dehydrogenase subunit alpha [Elioraea rosea]|uniref:formate dehydrogenase subunit alpha n=1 Tax=Elioraea rosea TaxID=2492390 RepID=UPI0011825D47|nr:formate dehydrogenase subunit alpha [Elioraea rosea]
MSVTFTLDGESVTAVPGETIWQVAQRRGTEIPHLCHLPKPGYRPDGNCRACLVEIEGERVLGASCIRTPAEGMVVRTASARAARARRMVFELLLADQPETLRDPLGPFARFAGELGVTESRFPRTTPPPEPDASHPAMLVQLDACIACGLCERACREVQHNDVIGLAHRGADVRVVFDAGLPMGGSTCVACGECVQACPTGALLAASVVVNGVRAVEPERVVDSVCPYCGVGCQVAFHVDEDRIVEVRGREGPSNQGRLCVKGRFGFDYVRHPERLTVPLVRIDGAAKDPRDSDTPAAARAKFREASWDEALERAAAGLRRVRDRDGPDALAGFGSAKGSNEEAYLFQKLVRTGFGTNNVDHCTRLCHAASVAALLEGIGSGAVTAPFTAVADAEFILIIGASPAVNHPVAATFIKDAAARGATLAIADPRPTPLDRFARHVLRFRPGADVALLNAMLHVIVAERLYDEAFVAARTEGFEALAGHVRGFAPEAMAPICGVAAEEIRTVARAYATSRASIILWGMGISQSVHGTDNARALVALALLCGHVGRPGTGLHPLRGQNNVQGASDAGLIPMMLPDYHRVADDAARREAEALWGVEISAEPGLTVVEILHAAEEGSIRAMLIMGENPAMSDPDAAHARSALASLEHLVVQDLFLTETAALADVVLPASAWPEKTGTVTNTNRQVQMGRAALAVPGEARQDLWILVELARRLGLAWEHRPVSEVYAEMAQLMPSLANIPWERVEREGSVTYPAPTPGAPGEEIVFADRFPTSSGRARLVPAALSDPAELPDSAYPFILTTGRQLEHWHTGTMTRRTAALDALEPSPTLSLAPADIRRLGLKPGGLARVTTRRGEIVLAVRAAPGLPDGLAFIPFAYREAAANLLTHPALDPIAHIPGFKHCAARIERADRAAGQPPASRRESASLSPVTGEGGGAA